MLAHPAGKGLPPEGYPSNSVLRELIAMAPVQDDQPGVAELLAKITAPPLPSFDEDVYEVASELAATLISKQADYGPRAISQAPGGPTLGVLVRAHDKLERLAHLTSKEGLISHESVRDSWLDLAGYAVIGLMVAEGTWPS